MEEAFLAAETSLGSQARILKVSELLLPNLRVHVDALHVLLEAHSAPTSS